MPDPIATRPYTIHPELFAWPSFRLSSERALWLYALLLGAISFLLTTGMQMPWMMAILVGAGLVGFAFGLAFVRHKAMLGKPANRNVYQNVVVSLGDEEVRQDFADESFLAIKLFAVKTFREIGDFYFVIASPRHSIVVPKTAFETPAESMSFARRLREAVGSHSRVSTKPPRAR